MLKWLLCVTGLHCIYELYYCRFNVNGETTIATRNCNVGIAIDSYTCDHTIHVAIRLTALICIYQALFMIINM